MPMTPSTPATSHASSHKSSRLMRFLNDLSLRPNDPPYDLNEHTHYNTVPLPAGKGASTQAVTALNANSAKNPESDSFAYIETLLESLAVLGKLGSALDTVAQRVSKELFSVVENTLDEVEERAEYGRRGSTLLNAGGDVPDKLAADGVYMFIPETGDARTSMAVINGPFTVSSLRLTALESSAKKVDHEILNDLFWTLYSKLDAITQGLRVVYEVANRIGSVSLKIFL